MQTSGRIVVVVVLRSFALFGFILSHAVDGFLAGPPPGADFMQFGPLDHLVVKLEHLLTFGKFFTIFSFLFGLSFAIQLRNATEKGAGFAGRFAWRLAVLALIALVHSAFFTGDILIVYALLGLLLIPFRRLKTRTLVITALILVLNVPGLLLGGLQLAAPPTPEQQKARAELTENFLQSARHLSQVKQSGSASELVHLNLTTGAAAKTAFMIFSGRLWMTFGLFLLGMCAGRIDLFKDTEANRQFFRRWLWPAGGVALVTSLIEIAHPTGMQVTSALDLFGWFSFTVQQMSLSAFYVALVALLYWRKPSQGVLPALAPLGKMGLTSYLGQTVFAVVVFYGIGFGLIGKVGAAAAAGMAVVFFIAQILFARAWLSRFSLGPVEWLWRSLTYFTLRPQSRRLAGTA
jgi:uncharacterized protein